MEQRKTRRFTLQLPVALTRAGTQHLTESSITQNISSGGVLFTADHEPDIGGPIEYVITLIGGTRYQVNLKCIGKVVRYEQVRKGSSDPKSFTVAATVERYEFVRPNGGEDS